MKRRIALPAFTLRARRPSLLQSAQPVTATLTQLTTLSALTTMPTQTIVLGKGSQGPLVLNLAMLCRHGLVAGATGTGKTATLRVIIEGLSQAGVPVFVPDIKGDLFSVASPGIPSDKLISRAEAVGLPGGYSPQSFPTIPWILAGRSPGQGHPVRIALSEMGPLLTGCILGLNDTQQSILSVLFRIADEQGLLLIDTKDLSALIMWATEHQKELKGTYGGLSSNSLGVIARKLTALEDRGLNSFFGEPSLQMADLMLQAPDGRGYVNILDARSLITDAAAYSSLLLWLLSELFEELPEVGDLAQPKLALVFDEAHIIFACAGRELREKFEMVVRLIRSKGVAVIFVTQNPLDLPDAVLGQLGNRIQHAMRAFTAKDQKQVKALADTFRRNPAFETSSMITELGIGEALVSLLNEDGSPGIVERTLIAPPRSLLAAAPDALWSEALQRSPIGHKYDQSLDRESAFEALRQRENAPTPTPNNTTKEQPSLVSRTFEQLASSIGRDLIRRIGNSISREIVRGVLGTRRR